jgi:hypothetical protein
MHVVYACVSTYVGYVCGYASLCVHVWVYTWVCAHGGVGRCMLLCVCMLVEACSHVSVAITCDKHADLSVSKSYERRSEPMRLWTSVRPTQQTHPQRVSVHVCRMGGACVCADDL